MPPADDNHALWFALGHYQGHGRGHYSIAATCIWRGMFPSEAHLARSARQFIRTAW